MVDILHYAKVRYWRGASARSNDYNICFDPNERSVAPETKQRGRPRTTYNYSVKIVHDPLDVGGFAAGTEFSLMDYTCMLQNSSFTPGTELIIHGALQCVYSNNGRQRVKKLKPVSS